MPSWKQQRKTSHPWWNLMWVIARELALPLLFISFCQELKSGFVSLCWRWAGCFIQQPVEIIRRAEINLNYSAISADQAGMQCMNLPCLCADSALQNSTCEIPATSFCALTVWGVTWRFRWWLNPWILMSLHPRELFGFGILSLALALAASPSWVLCPWQGLCLIPAELSPCWAPWCCKDWEWLFSSFQSFQMHFIMEVCLFMWIIRQSGKALHLSVSHRHPWFVPACSAIFPVCCCCQRLGTAAAPPPCLQSCHQTTFART